VNCRAEDVVGFEEPGCEKQSGHDAGRPVEDQQRESRGQSWRRIGLGFAEDDAAYERDGGGEREEPESVNNSVVQGLVGLKDDLRVLDREEEGVEEGVEGEQTEEKSDGFGEFEQHAQGPRVCT